MILGNIDRESIEWIGPACAVMALTVVYGYFVRALCWMAILSREAELLLICFGDDVWLPIQLTCAGGAGGAFGDGGGGGE